MNNLIYNYIYQFIDSENSSDLKIRKRQVYNLDLKYKI